MKLRDKSSWISDERRTPSTIRLINGGFRPVEFPFARIYRNIQLSSLIFREISSFIWTTKNNFILYNYLFVPTLKSLILNAVVVIIYAIRLTLTVRGCGTLVEPPKSLIQRYYEPTSRYHEISNQLTEEQPSSSSSSTSRWDTCTGNSVKRGTVCHQRRNSNSRPSRNPINSPRPEGPSMPRELTTRGRFTTITRTSFRSPNSNRWKKRRAIHTVEVIEPELEIETVDRRWYVSTVKWNC